MVTRHEEEGHGHEEERADDQVEARAEHVIDLAHIVGGAGHCVTHRLEVMKGHALAKQGKVELVADIALEALGEQFRPEIAAKLEDAADDLRAADNEGEGKK